MKGFHKCQVSILVGQAQDFADLWHLQNDSSNIFSCAPGLWPGAQHYITLCHLLSEWVTDWVSEYVRKLKISVYIDARTLTFGIKLPWIHWLRFRKNQFEGPYEKYVLAIKGPCFGHFYEMGMLDAPGNVKFGMEHPFAHWLGFRKNQFEGPCKNHNFAITGPCFGHF